MTTSKIKALALAGGAAALFALSSCDTPSYSNTDNIASGENSNLLTYDSVSVSSVSATLSSDFVRGFDASDVDEQELDNKITWYNSSAEEEDFFEILKDNGVNTVRLRIWNDPDTFASKNSLDVPSGDCTLERTLRLAKRVKNAGLKLMLDFHYSDYWADPGKQIVPLGWQSLTSADKVAKALYNYTYDVMDKLNDIGATPDYVQIGNEINNGILLHTGIDSSTGYGSGDFAYAGTDENLVTYLSAGAKAVRLTAPSAKIILHVASSNHPDSAVSKISSVDFDIIGLSYYPIESSHGTVSALKSRIESYRENYSKDVMIVETTFKWNCSSSADDSELVASYSNLVDPDTSAVYSDLETKTVSESPEVLGTIQNQANVIRHIIEETAESGGIGVCTWGGEVGDWKATSNNWPYSDSASTDEKTGKDYMMLPSLAVFNVKGN